MECSVGKLEKKNDRTLIFKNRQLNFLGGHKISQNIYGA